jgi:hypothetical protein
MLSSHLLLQLHVGRRIWGSHSGGFEEFYLLGYNAVKSVESQLLACVHVGFLLSLFFDPENGGDIFLRNVGWLSTDFTALYPRRQSLTVRRFSTKCPYQNSVCIPRLLPLNNTHRPPSLSYLSLYRSISLWLSIPLLGLGRFFSFLIFLQSVGLPGRGTSQSQGRYLHKEQHKHRINAQRHPCLEWDSNPRSQRSSERRQFMPQSARPLWSARYPISDMYKPRPQFHCRPLVIASMSMAPDVALSASSNFSDQN